MKLNIPFKNFIICLIVVILLFTPTYFAIASYNANQIDPTLATNLTQLTIKDPLGNTTTVTSENDPDKLIDMFKALVDDATRISSLPDNIAGESFLLVSYTTTGGENPSSYSYKYYFSTNSDACYFTGPNGENFKIDVDCAKRFLASPYSIYLYDNAAPPVLSTEEGNVINPSNISWQFLAAGGLYQEYNKISTSETVLDYDVGSTMKFNFSIEPDECNLKVFNGSAVWYDGAFNKFHESLPKIERNTVLTFLIEATWERTDNCQYFGEATYSFNTNITALADFKLGANSIQHGEFVVISGINVADPSLVKFESSPAIDFTPVFYADGTEKDVVHALVPIKYTLNNSGTYTFTVSYGVSERTLNLNVTKNQYDTNKEPTTDGYHFGARKYGAKKSLIDTNFTESLINSAKNTFTTICSNASPTRYFSDKVSFINYFNGNALYPNGGSLAAPHLLGGFGRKLTLTEDPSRSFLNSGIEFHATSTRNTPTNSIPAVENGVVCATGYDEVMGKYIVIDHGYGLRTWYTNLGEVNVKLNDKIQKGHAIAKGGGSGFVANANNARIMFTVGNAPISPYTLFDTGIIFPEF
jgi:murein DD-endopeptidase MepM/ murein hydrolase activator NlpD